MTTPEKPCPFCGENTLYWDSGYLYKCASCQVWIQTADINRRALDDDLIRAAQKVLSEWVPKWGDKPTEETLSELQIAVARRAN